MSDDDNTLYLSDLLPKTRRGKVIATFLAFVIVGGVVGGVLGTRHKSVDASGPKTPTYVPLSPAQQAAAKAAKAQAAKAQAEADRRNAKWRTAYAAKAQAEADRRNAKAAKAQAEAEQQAAEAQAEADAEAQAPSYDPNRVAPAHEPGIPDDCQAIIAGLTPEEQIEPSVDAQFQACMQHKLEWRSRYDTP